MAGAGIYSTGALLVSNTSVTNNSDTSTAAANITGGGIYSPATITLAMMPSAATPARQRVPAISRAPASMHRRDHDYRVYNLQQCGDDWNRNNPGSRPLHDAHGADRANHRCCQHLHRSSRRHGFGHWNLQHRHVHTSRLHGFREHTDVDSSRRRQWRRHFQWRHGHTFRIDEIWQFSTLGGGLLNATNSGVGTITLADVLLQR